MTEPASPLALGLEKQYQLLRELGRGGMATVYLAQDLKHDRPVALKVLSPQIAAAIGTERFEREIRLAARLQHPHICSVYDSGNTAGQLWFTMPYVEGEALDARLERSGPLPVDEALRIAREAAQALAYAHEQGVVHRDIKPANLLLARDGSTLVADFGIARALGTAHDTGTQTLTQSGFSVGTPAYMSPEQAAGVSDLDGRSDGYSLGLVLYEMLAGKRPFTGNSPAVFAQLTAEPVPPVRNSRPEVPAEVDRVLRRALAFNPAERYPTMAEFGAALESLRTGSSVARGEWWSNRRGLGRIAWSASSLVALLVAIYLWRSGPRGEPAVPLASAAVLPFADLSPAHDQTYFSDGLTEELTNALSRLPGFHVAARSSAFQFRGPAVDVHDVGRRLGVGSVLEGSVRKSGNRLRVSAQLVNTTTGYELWSDTYDRDLADVFQVQEEIARAIVSALRVRLAATTDSALVTRPTQDLEAYDLFLKGQFALNQRSEATLPEAVRYFEQALARDSGFARASVGLADAYLLLPLYTSAVSDTTWPRAKAAALRAIALGGGGSLGEAYTSLAYGTMLYEWNWAESERQFQRAIAADPNYPTAHHWYGDYLAGRGRLEEGLREMRRAAELDPLSRIIGTEYAWMYLSLHRLDEADSALAKILRLDPNFPQANIILGQIRLAQGGPKDAVVLLRRALEDGGFNAHAVGILISAYAAAGDRAHATALLDSLSVRAKREYVPPFAFALAYTGLGDRDRAFAALERGFKERDALLPENFFEPAFDALKTDPRYAGVVARLK